MHSQKSTSKPYHYKNQLFDLYVLFFKSIKRRLQIDLINEAVVIFCGLVIGSLFFYIIHDFFNEALATVDGKLQVFLLNILAKVITFAVFVISSKKILHYKNAFPTIATLPQTLNQRPNIITSFSWIVGIHIALFYFGPSTAIIYSLLSIQEFQNIFPYLMIAFASSVILGVKFNPPRWQKNSNAKPYSPKSLRRTSDGSSLTVLVEWRMYQILFRRKISQWFVLLTCISAAMTGFLVAKPSHEVVIYLFAIITGTLASFVISQQASVDAESSWLDRYIGLSHHHYLLVMEILGLLIGISLVIVFLLSFSLSTMIIDKPFSQALATAIALMSFPPLLQASFIFQIDVKKPMIQYMVSIIVSLFVGTAIIASIYSLVLLPFLRSYARQQQHNRFYRIKVT